MSSASPLPGDTPASDASRQDSALRPGVARLVTLAPPARKECWESGRSRRLCAVHSLAARSSRCLFVIVIRFLPISIIPAVFNSLSALLFIPATIALLRVGVSCPTYFRLTLQLDALDAFIARAHVFSIARNNSPRSALVNSGRERRVLDPETFSRRTWSEGNEHGIVQSLVAPAA